MLRLYLQLSQELVLIIQVLLQHALPPAHVLCRILKPDGIAIVDFELIPFGHILRRVVPAECGH